MCKMQMVSIVFLLLPFFYEAIAYIILIGNTFLILNQSGNIHMSPMKNDLFESMTLT